MALSLLEYLRLESLKRVSYPLVVLGNDEAPFLDQVNGKFALPSAEITSLLPPAPAVVYEVIEIEAPSKTKRSKKDAGTENFLTSLFCLINESLFELI